MAGSTRQGHKGIQFSGGLSQLTKNIKNSRRPFVSHSPIRLATVQTPITTTPPPTPHAIPFNGGQQIEDGRLVLDGGVQCFGAPSCKESGAEARIGGSIEAPDVPPGFEKADADPARMALKCKADEGFLHPNNKKAKNEDASSDEE